MLDAAVLFVNGGGVGKIGGGGVGTKIEARFQIAKMSKVIPELNYSPDNRHAVWAAKDQLVC